MSFDALKKIVGQQSVVVVDVYCDQNDPAIESWLEDTSYNTPKTTTLPGAYNPDTPKKLYRFSNQQLGAAAGTHFPILTSFSITPPQINDSIGLRAGFNFSISDITTNDIYELPQEFSDRRVEGSFVVKWLSRNYLHNRTVVFRQGFDPLNFDLANFQSQTFIMDKVQGPSYRGGATFACLDPLIWTEESKAKAPLKSSGELVADIDTSGSQSIQLTGTEDTGEYGTIGFILIDSEICGYTVTSDTPPTIDMTITRFEWGTTEEDHVSGALAQRCFYAEGENVTDIILRLFEFTNISAEMIDTGQFEQAKLNDLATVNLTGILSSPTGVGETISDLLTHAQSQIYFNTVRNLVELIYIAEYESPSYTLDAQLDILPNSLQLIAAEDEQVTRQAVDWERLNAASTETANYSKGYSFQDTILEGPGVYGEVAEGETLVSNWLGSSSDDTQTAVAISQRIVQKRAKMPVYVNFNVDLADISAENDGFWLGNFISIVNSPVITGPDLESIPLNFQVISIKSGNNDVYSISGLSLSQPAQDFDYIIEESAENIVLSDLYPPISGKRTVIFIRSNDVVTNERLTIGSSSSTLYSLDTGNYPDGLLIRNRGQIFGRGGDGGDAGPQGVTNPGDVGGGALILNCDTIIDNSNGGLFYGGGGGGSGTPFEPDLNPIPGVDIDFDGCGGGGGQGYDTSSGGAALDQGGVDGNPGGSGNENGPGLGGLNETYPNENRAANGGAFGEQSEFNGALPGDAINTNGQTFLIDSSGYNDFQMKPLPPLSRST